MKLENYFIKAAIELSRQLQESTEEFAAKTQRRQVNIEATVVRIFISVMRKVVKYVGGSETVFFHPGQS